MINTAAFPYSRVVTYAILQLHCGVFYKEPSGAYVRVSEQQGLPESLVEPLIAAIKKKVRDR